jgi:hypothetical protein
MKVNIRYYTCVFFAILFMSCEEDEGPKGKYEDGVIVVNEGGFGDSNGTLTHYNPDTKEAQQNVFRSSGSDFAGDVVQSLNIENDKAYIVVNDDNKIEVANANTFEAISTITHSDIEKPRYVEVINQKAYISVWGPYDKFYSLIDSYVLVYDLKTNQVIKKIDTNEGVQNLTYDGKRLFALSYEYGGSSTLAVIDPNDDSLVEQIEIGPGSSAMVLDNNGKLWVIISGTDEGNDGTLIRINTSSFAIEQEIDLGLNPNAQLAITSDKKNIIYSEGNDIYKISTNATSAPVAPLIDASDVVTPYALAVNPENDEIYFADALNYKTPGTIYIYNSDGSFMTTFTAGINPTQFIFK